MAKSFVLAQAVDERGVMGKLNKIPGVLGVYPLYGKDCNLMVEVETGDEVKKEIEKITGMSVMKVLNGC